MSENNWNYLENFYYEKIYSKNRIKFMKQVKNWLNPGLIVIENELIYLFFGIS